VDPVSDTTSRDVIDESLLRTPGDMACPPRAEIR